MIHWDGKVVDGGWLLLRREKATKELKDLLEMKDETPFVREDYREVAELAVRVLGGHIGDHHFRKPGAYRQTRWMASLIYCSKSWLFRGQLDLSAEDTDKCRCLNQFVCLFYATPWLKAPLTAEAMAIDLRLMQDRQWYQRTEKPVARAALEVLVHHQWYLSPELAVFGFWSTTDRAVEQMWLQSCCSSLRI